MGNFVAFFIIIKLVKFVRYFQLFSMFNVVARRMTMKYILNDATVECLLPTFTVISFNFLHF